MKRERIKETGSGQTETHFVYIVLCRDNTLYTGWTTDINRRLKAHNSGKGAKYTRARRPVRLVHLEAYPTKSEALRRERAIKRLTAAKKRELIGCKNQKN